LCHNAEYDTMMAKSRRTRALERPAKIGSSKAAGGDSMSTLDNLLFWAVAAIAPALEASMGLVAFGVPAV